MPKTLTEEDEAPATEELVVTEVKPVAKPKEEEEEDEEPEKPAKAADADAAGVDDEEREAIRERRRAEKAERKERRETAIRRNNLEMDFLRKRNDDLEKRLDGLETHAVKKQASDVDAELAKVQREFKMAEEVIAKAVAAGNGEDVAQALRYRDGAVAKYNQLVQTKQQAEQRPAQQAAPNVDPAVLRHAQKFIGDHAWYDPKGGDEDSAIVLAVDNTLVREGFDPKDADYWTELRKRVARRLPDRFTAADDDGNDDEAPAQRKPRGGPAVGSGREHAPQSTRKEVYISPERKQALIDAGVWEDPILRMKYVKQYAAYDKNARNKA